MSSRLVPNGPRVEEVVQVLADTPKLLRSLGVEHPADLVEMEIGRGAFAIAFRTPLGLVLKTTMDPDDAQAMFQLLELQEEVGGPVPGLPLVHGVYAVPSPVNERYFRGSELQTYPVALYAIVVEPVLPLQDMQGKQQELIEARQLRIGEAIRRRDQGGNRKWWLELQDDPLFAESAEQEALQTEHYRDDIVRLRQLILALHSLSTVPRGDRRDPTVLDLLAEEFLLDAQAKEWLQQLAHGIAEMKDRGFDVDDDLHAGNIGLTEDRRAVILDLGNSMAPDAGEQDIPMAQNPARSVEVKDRWSNQHAIDLAAWVDGDLAGNLTASPVDVQGESVWSVASIYVCPEYRRSGVGQALWEEAAVQAELRGGRLASTYRTSQWSDAFWQKQVGAGAVDVIPRAGLTGEDVYILRKGAVMANPVTDGPDSVVIDNLKGIGSTPNNENVDYLGLRVRMQPSVFLLLARHLPEHARRSKTMDFVGQAMAEGRGIGAPSFYLDIPEGWEDGIYEQAAQIRGHEGRHRCVLARELFGDRAIEVHLFFNGGYRRRHLRPEWIENIRSRLVSEDGRLVESRRGLFELDGDGLTRNGTSSVDRAFDEAFDAVERKFPDLGTIELYEDEAAGADNGAGSERQFAYCMDGNPIRIAFAPKAEDLPLNRLRGLVRHEFGHALEFRYGLEELQRRLGVRLPEYSERRADAVAELVFGEPVLYDHQNIQCVRVAGAKKKRPRHLPDKREVLKPNGPGASGRNRRSR
jgi:GNAT superfamily N-acetyltransferase